MKTAMQELHEWAVNKWSDPSRLISLYEVVNKIGEMLEKDKQHIITAYKEGCSDRILDDILEKEKEQIVNAYKEGCYDGGFFDEK